MTRSVRSSLGFLTAERLVMNTAYRFVYPFLPVIARGLGVPLEQAGYLVSVRHIAGLATPGITRVVGRGELRRRLIVTGVLLFIVGSAVTVLTNTYVGALIGFALLGFAKPVYDVSSQAYIADRVPYERRARYLAVFEFTWAGALLVGAPAAGWLISKGDWATPFWAFGVLTVAALLLVPRFVDADHHHAMAQRASVRFGRSGLTFLAVAGLFSLASEMIIVVFGAWLEDSFGLSLAALGGAAILIGAAELAGEGATFGFTDRIGKRRAVLIGLMISAVGFALLVPARDEIVVGLAILAIALFGFEFTIVSSIPLASELQPSSRAQYLAWMVVAMSLARGVGAATGPTLFQTFGLPGPALVAVAADVLAMVLLLVWVREGAGSGEEAEPG
ncbi:MAG: MFS transporter [Actinomycetota bacterium]|nr:MFS transporter [Actinomycetota bacterium]